MKNSLHCIQKTNKTKQQQQQQQKRKKRCICPFFISMRVTLVLLTVLLDNKDKNPGNEEV